MKNRLILIEGIPGSGKTTIAEKVKSNIEAMGIKVKLYSEGDVHPADLAWMACIPIDEYEHLLKNKPKHAKEIEKLTIFEDEYAIVAYTKLKYTEEDKELIEYFENYEVYDGRVSFEVFRNLHFKRWEKFNKELDKDTVVIFECAYLQNHVNELMGQQQKDVEFITEYMIELIETVKELNPKLIYLTQQSVHKTISYVAKERISQNKNIRPDWIDLVIDYVENSPYGKENDLKGFDGVIKFFQNRKEIELSIIDKLPIDKIVINNLNGDLEEVFQQVESELQI